MNTWLRQASVLTFADEVCIFSLRHPYLQTDEHSGWISLGKACISCPDIDLRALFSRIGQTYMVHRQNFISNCEFLVSLKQNDHSELGKNRYYGLSTVLYAFQSLNPLNMSLAEVFHFSFNNYGEQVVFKDWPIMNLIESHSSPLRNRSVWLGESSTDDSSLILNLAHSCACSASWSRWLTLDFADLYLVVSS